MDAKQDLIGLQKALFDFSRRNPFVHIQPNKLWSKSQSESNNTPEKLYQKASFYWKEYGLETTLDVDCFIKWLPPNLEGNNAKNSYLVSPLFYTPCKIKRTRKIDTEFTVEKTGDRQSNPILKHYFNQFFDFELLDEIPDLEIAIKKIMDFFVATAVESESIKHVTGFDDNQEWQLIRQSAVGNFNYKKSALGADYHKIIQDPNQQILRLLAHEGNKPERVSIIPQKPITQLDQSQKEVIDLALNNSTVIQGPPGTGKSHTIVALIASFLAANKRVLFVSEKRSALDVVTKRLDANGLDNLVAYFNTNKDQKKEFYRRLKETWETLSKRDEYAAETFAQKTESNLFEFYPIKLNVFNERLDGNLQDLLTVLLQSGLKGSDLKVKGKVPTYAEWKKHYSFLIDFEASILPVFNAKSLANTDFIQLNNVLFAEPQVLLILEKRLDEMKAILKEIKAVQQVFDLDDTYDEFVRLALTASILAMVDKVQIDLLNTDSKKYKSFNSWAKKYQLLKTKVKQAELANEKWTKKPSNAEILELLDLLKSADRKTGNSIFSRLRRNPEKLKTAFTDFHSGISIHTKIKLLEALQHEWRLKGELEEVAVKLRHNLNIHDPENEIDLIFNLRNKLDAVSPNQYIRILEHYQSSDLIPALAKIHPSILKFSAQNRFLFHESNVSSIHDFDEKLDALKLKLPQLNRWLPEIKSFFQLPAGLRNFIRNNAASINDLNAAVAYQNVLDETRFDPYFKQLSGWSLIQEAQMISAVKNDTFAKNRLEIFKHAQNAHLNAEELLAKPTYKLKDAQKQSRKRYKREKRQILHEVNKQQRHQSVKTFFEETEAHLLKMQPLWVMNPLTVSENLPCVKNLFDVVIFDESSQIPLEDAIPAIYRAKQVVVVGDSKQMPPSAFFRSSTETITLLDQAERVFSNKMLKWHYRSEHPDLIRFSNMEFYNNELITLPPRTPEKPLEIKSVKGNYDSGKNELEAMEIAHYCQQSVDFSTNSVVIIAFSIEQEKEINRQLKKLKLDERENLTTRNLENAQGIEGDVILVSIGYGKNESGDFRLNFGPVNQAMGANRLNVLFTRAKQKMVVFTSVLSADFGLSDNRGVQVLKDFLSYAENLDTAAKKVTLESFAHQKVYAVLTKHNAEFQYYPAKNGNGISVFTSHSRNTVLLVDPGIGEDQVKDVQGLISMFSNRYKKVKVVLSIDLWTNFERVEQDVVDLFCGKA